MPVHIYGQPCEMDKIKKLQSKNIYIVEDAAEALGATYKMQKSAYMVIAHALVYANKTITTGRWNGCF